MSVYTTRTDITREQSGPGGEPGPFIRVHRTLSNGGVHTDWFDLDYAVEYANRILGAANDIGDPR